MSIATSSHRVILITGATGGIGQATAIAFAKTGQHHLALHYNSASASVRRELLEKIIEASPSKHGKVDFFQADMADYDSVRKMHEKVIKTFEKVDILFNNAGSTLGHTGVQSLAEVPIDVFEKTWRVNTGSAILLTQLCLPQMEAQEWGRVIFCSSVAAFTGGFVGPHYASSKSGLHGLVHWLANNVAKRGVTVNAVAPATIKGTAMMGDSDGALKRVADKLPVGRLGEPSEIADTVMWMAKTGYVTNKVITVDGGMYPY